VTLGYLGDACSGALPWAVAARLVGAGRGGNAGPRKARNPPTREASEDRGGRGAVWTSVRVAGLQVSSCKLGGGNKTTGRQTTDHRTVRAVPGGTPATPRPSSAVALLRRVDETRGLLGFRVQVESCRLGGGAEAGPRKARNPPTREASEDRGKRRKGAEGKSSPKATEDWGWWWKGEINKL
jgi:hypothetical protein